MITQADDRFADFGAPLSVRERTSVMAILSMVFGIICVPGFGLVGLILGIGAIVGINSSRGRLGGTGLAVAGIAFSLLACIVWVGMGLGLMQAKKVIEQDLEHLMTSVYAVDLDAARTVLDEPSHALLTEDACKTFTAAIDARLGRWTGFPQGFWKFFGGFGALNEANKHAERLGLLTDATAWPAEFERGNALLIVHFTTLTPGKWLKGHVRNIGVITNDGQVDWLLPRTP
ncbi:MAG: DUF4190 domain-containing protein [Phycisphaeraceae bacterium]|nr:DUF4190 domain-containing protein [Phycisphaeraceae bacterium]